MKKITLLSLLVVCSSLVMGQIRTPAPSPAATIMQTVGVTDLTVKYSRPSMKGREIFGKLIPFGNVWRTGANQATSFEASSDITVEGQKLAAGKYSIMSIPGQDEWTVVFSKNATVTEQNYKDADDALRVKVKPATTSMPIETLGFNFTDLTDSTANMYFAWEKTRINIKIGVETTAIVTASIDKASEQGANNATAGANYLLSKGKDLTKALGMVNQAVGYKENLRNLWTKAQILSKMGNFAEALPAAKKALEIGEATKDPAMGFLGDAIKKGISEYTSKIPAIPAGVMPKKK